MIRLNASDWISVYRIAAVPFLFLFIFFNERHVFAVFLLISFFSDYLDGVVARLNGQETDRGAKLDSVGDMLTLVVALVGLIFFEREFVIEQIFLLAGLFFLYIFQLVFSLIKYRQLSSFHTLLAKVAFLLQAVFLVSVFFIGIQYWLYYLVIGISFLEIIEEIVLTGYFKTWRSNVKGILWLEKKKPR